ncbi:MAG: hypothetical protein LQ352_007850 [Teloschistes flavicans]|nr:MAG: hypothetical protein LQ352_007850 [Teloschistes flavicans]
MPALSLLSKKKQQKYFCIHTVPPDEEEEEFDLEQKIPPPRNLGRPFVRKSLERDARGE